MADLFVEYWPESIQTTSRHGGLPLHLACRNMGHAFIDVIWHIFRLYPQAVRVQDDQYRLPLHIICERKPIPKKLAQRFVREWPASVQVAGQYYSFAFTKREDEPRSSNEGVEEENNGSGDLDNLDHNEEDEDNDMLYKRDYQYDNKDLDENEDQEDVTAVIDDQYVKRGTSSYLYVLPLDLVCLAREKPSLELIHILTNGRPPLHFICEYYRTPWIPTRMNNIEYLASILPDDGMRFYQGALPFHWVCRSRAPLSVLKWWCEHYPASASACTTHTQELPLHCYLSSKGTENREAVRDAHCNNSFFSAVQYLVQKHPSGLNCPTNPCGRLA